MSAARNRRAKFKRRVAAAEDLKEEQEDVEDIEEDARRDRNGCVVVRAAQPVEVDDREPAEDHEPEHAVDDVRVRDAIEETTICLYLQ